MAMILRVLVAIVLLYFAYHETGWATTAILALMFLGSEANGYINNLQTDAIREIAEHLEDQQ